MRPTPQIKAKELYDAYNTMLSVDLSHTERVYICKYLSKKCVQVSKTDDDINYWLDVFNEFK